MLGISTWHGPSAVSHCLKCTLTSEDRESLVIAKINRLEVYDLTPSGLEFRCSFDTWGTVTSLLTTQRKRRNLASLIVTTDHLDPKFYVLEFDASKSELLVAESLSLRLRVGREAEFFSGAVIHPNGKVIVSCQYSGTIKVIVLGDKSKVIETEFECRIPELNIHSLCFVPVSGHKLILAILSEDHNQRKHVIARELKLDEQELLYEQSTAISGGFAHEGATLLVPISGQRKTPGVLVLGGGTCHFFGSERATSKRASTGESKLSAVHSLAKGDLPLQGTISWCAIDENRFLLGDELGYLCLLGVDRAGASHAISDINVVELGQVSPSACLAHIDGSTFYSGSLCGDSQTIRLLPEAKSDGSYIEVLESYTNLGPILDAVLMDADGSGQVGASSQISRDSILLITTPFSTSIFELNAGSLDEVDPSSVPGFDRTQRTLAACTLARDQGSIQVTPNGIRVVDLISGIELERWPPQGSPAVEITAAAVNPTQACVALKGGKLIYFSLKTKLDLLREKEPEIVDGLPNEVAALAIEPHRPTTKTSSNVVAVAYWTKNIVTLYALPQFTPMTVGATTGASASVQEAHAPHSLVLHSFGHGGDSSPQLLIGLADGSLVTYSITDAGLLANRRASSLGNDRPVSFAPCAYFEAQRDDRVVLASASRGAIMWFDRKAKRLRTSTVAIKDAVSLCALDHSLYPDSVLVLSRAAMTIGSIGELNKLNVQTVQFGSDNPRQIAHHPALHALAVGFYRTQVNRATGNQTFSSSLKILDATSFEQLTQISCHVNEEITTVGVLDLGPPESITSYIVAGTTTAPPLGHIESTQGRILVLDGSDAHKLRVVAALNVPGCVYGLAAYQGNIAATVNSSVLVYGFELPKERESFQVNQKAKFDRGFQFVSIVSRGDVLAVTDALKSVSLLKLNGNKLECISQDYEASLPHGLEMLGEDWIISSELDFNLSLFKRESIALERVGGFHYGELANKFIAGTAFSLPKLVMVTASGRVSVVSDIDSETSKRLVALQRNLSYVLHGPGGVELSNWRAPRTARKTRPFAGFIDADFVERVLDLSPEDLKKVMEGQNQFERLAGSKEEIAACAEQLLSLH
ncbi:hypothetical protein FRC04_008332 [Tulasnella sp. 424]|nr:hypothetical protein FRC04_008332 [Tulasnella sp. 424]